MKHPQRRFPTLPFAIIASVLVGVGAGWALFGNKSPEVSVQPVSIFPLPPSPAVGVSVSTPPPSQPTAVAVPTRPPEEQILARAATSPGEALEAAGRLQNPATRATYAQTIMAGWLQKDRLNAAEWLAHHREFPEFEPLSAQVSNAFFPDDTEMASIWAFNIQNPELRQPLVDRLVKYWKSGAHLAYPQEETDSPPATDSPPTS